MNRIMNQDDPFELQRFIDVQATSYDMALTEIRRGAKRSHRMWLIFPQVAGLSSSAMAQRYAIGSLDEARAYLAHPMLGARLQACVAALQNLTGTTAETVFGSIDAVKLWSSLTLYVKAGGGPLIGAALTHWFGGSDQATLDILGRG